MSSSNRIILSLFGTLWTAIILIITQVAGDKILDVL